MAKEVVMRRKLVISLLITTFVLLAAPICRAGSFSASYKIKVYIPPIIGVNVPSAETATHEKIAVRNSAWETTIEEIVRGNETVIYKTTVLK